MFKLLVVCTGNICRSPTAEGVLAHHIANRKLDDKITVDSAGTHGYHIGEPPDPRSIKAARSRGIDIARQRSRKVTPKDFHEFDIIFALDAGHLRDLKKMTPKDARAEIVLFLDYAGQPVKEVPDPYYGDEAGFEYVLDLIEAAAHPVLEKLTPRL